MQAAHGRVDRILTAFLAAGLAAALASTATPAHAAPNRVRLMVDPGHGGSDPGAASNGLNEKDSNLRIGRMVVQAAKRQGWAVATTRADDRFIGLAERPARANSWKATALVSVHSNSVGSPKNVGHMTIYRGAAGARLGKSIMDELAPLTAYKDLGNRSDVRGLAVLRRAKQPAVIVELLSVTSPSESRKLRDPVAQRVMAEAIVRGIARFHGVKYVPAAAPKKAVTPAAKAITPVLAKAPPSKTATETSSPQSTATTRPPVPAPADRAVMPRAKADTAGATVTEAPEITPTTRVDAVKRHTAPVTTAGRTRVPAAVWSLQRILSFFVR
jgi:N-acetylmuramoyl-L-alanine amidase